MKFVDLHLHSRCSDGTYAPEELAALAQRYDLSAVALTDHDSLEGCPRAAAACHAAEIEFVTGTELTAELDGNEIHLLGYYLDMDNLALLEALAKFQAARQNRIREIVARINDLDIPLQSETVFTLANCRSPGRPHVGRALVQEGFCATQDEAFDRFLKKHRPAWVPKFKISALDAIALIHQAGGLAVMAHPGLNRTDGAIPKLVQTGLDGLECYHSKHPPGTVSHYLHMAQHFNLLVTGGSDCHGVSKGKATMGSVKLPYIYMEQLQARHLCVGIPYTPTTCI